MKEEHLTRILQAGIRAVRPADLFPRIFSDPARESVRDWLQATDRYLLCVGKAAISSAESILKATNCRGLFVLSPAGIGSGDLPPEAVHRGTHPVPDENSVRATTALLNWLDALPDGARMLVVLSGGASALLVCPPPDVSIESKFRLNALLLASGASIGEMNAVRKHCSAVKGGQLGLLASRLRVNVLAVSDVVGDDPAVIGSGPFYPDPTTFSEAGAVLKSYGIWNDAPADIRRRLECGIAGEIAETPKPGALTIRHEIVASNELAQQAAEAEAARLGYKVHRLAAPVTGFVEDAAASIHALIRECPPGTALILGGEVTVRLKGSGKGGRNQHLALLMTERIAGTGICFAAMGTDGIDGNSEAAGAWTCGATATRARDMGLDVADSLRRFDSFPFFRALHQSIVTGPSGTNVMDLYLALT